MGDSILSKRQRECLQGVADHLDSQQIAHRLGISPHTVDGHVASAVKALGARTRREAVTLWKALEPGEQLTGEFSPLHQWPHGSADVTPSSGVEEARIAFVTDTRENRREIDDAHNLKTTHLRTTALIVGVAAALAIVLASLGPLVDGAKNLANFIMPYH